MELRYLLYFATVAEHLSFTRAAESFSVARPAVSQQIKTLEEELEVKLLVRTKRSVKLTTAGHAFLREAKDILNRVEQSRMVARRAARGETATLSIGCFSAASSLFLPELAVHLLREYGAAVLMPKTQYGGLPRQKLVRAVEYIQDQLNADLTVSGIAHAVGMSRNHFTRLFKESTGQTPYQYVVDARVKKAKELLTTGKFTISQAAYHVGFVDQSHLTRHFKRVFGLPPSRMLSCRKPQIVF
jgi:DNA-binding transcriptional LysR family regulator